eukprot:13102803-Alexandrium_andersonii.AAC.1
MSSKGHRANVMFVCFATTRQQARANEGGQQHRPNDKRRNRAASNATRFKTTATASDASAAG